MNKTIGLGLFGCGGRLRGVVKGLLLACPEARVVAVVDPDPLAIRDARREFGKDVPACRTATELAHRADVDWVFVGSFNCHHAAPTIAAFRAGKNVFCEKPLALSSRSVWCSGTPRSTNNSKRGLPPIKSGRSFPSSSTKR